MSFSNPWAFFLLLILIPFIFVVIYNFKKKRRIINSFFSDKAYKDLSERSGREIDFFKASLLILSFLFLIIALAGPQWGKRFENVNIKGVEMIFLLDASFSMNAEDLKPNRLEVAKELINTIVSSLETDYVGLINFAGKAYIQCPLTIDYSAFTLLLNATEISPDEEQGTDFSEAFTLALKTADLSKTGEKIVFFITDGEDQEQKWDPLIKDFKKRGIIIFPIGVGATIGAPIPVKDKNGNMKGWKKDKKGNIVKTKLNEQVLIKIASETGGRYFRLTDSGSIDDFIRVLRSFERTALRKKVKSVKVRRFQYPLIIGIILLILELILSEKKILWKKRY
ncbi:MAG: VWA domain-containing protein [Acidobacteriota bacterium]